LLNLVNRAANIRDPGPVQLKAFPADAAAFDRERILGTVRVHICGDVKHFAMMVLAVTPCAAFKPARHVSSSLQLTRPLRTIFFAWHVADKLTSEQTSGEGSYKMPPPNR
jgi:hypothetical protein